MNSLNIIGNLTRDPELRTTPGGINVCSFTVAVNRKQTKEQREKGQSVADYFNCTAWDKLADVCAKCLTKGKKVAVRGPVSARAFTNSNNEARASLELKVDDIEFLSPRENANAPQPVEAPENPFTEQPDDLPY